MSSNKLEKFALQLSVGGTLFMSILGVTFGLWLASEAILLDGFFNVISLIMAIASLWISWLIRQPEGKQFQFGYLNFVPLVNLSKGLLISVLSLFALASAVSALLRGGRMLNPGMAVIYALIAASGCFIIAITQNIISKKTRSPMVIVDSKNWLINGAISLSVGIAFGIVAFIQGTSLSWFVAYADPTIVMTMVLVTIPVPIKIIIESTNQLLLGAPSSALQKQLRIVLETAIKDLPCAKHWLRMTQIGQYIYVHIYWLLPKDFAAISVEKLDRIRAKITRLLEQTYRDITIDIIFTQDQQWVEQMNPQRE